MGVLTKAKSNQKWNARLDSSAKDGKRRQDLLLTHGHGVREGTMSWSGIHQLLDRNWAGEIAMFCRAETTGWLAGDRKRGSK